MQAALDLSSMTTLVLCGGLGTRLRAVIGERPKALAPIAGHPFLHYLLRYLQRQHVRDVVLCTGFGAAEIEAYCQDGRAWQLEIRYSCEDRPLGTAGAIKQAESYVRSNPLCVLNGDSLVQADLSTLVQFHRAKQARMTLCLVEVPSRARFGSVTLAADGTIISFGEKRHQQAGLINAGLYVMDQAVLQMIPPGSPLSLERDVLPRMIGQRLYGLVAADPFIDIGTPETYTLAQSLLPDWMNEAEA
ncbi:MAG: nucleotidyltransferase family protein [Blastocatellia bacterium]|nr:nucleotidyltransferase family protein [Blastocatellia bacterium]